MAKRASRRVNQAWVELLAEDPEAISALSVARARLPAAAHLERLRRLRVFELCGPLPGRSVMIDLLRRSTRFYNPHKERCIVRSGAGDPAPIHTDEHVVLVMDRDGGRCPAAERWWVHETGSNIEVREAIAWVLSFTTGAVARECVDDLATLRDRRHGLLCHPIWQQLRTAVGNPPLPWLSHQSRPGEGRGAGRQNAR